MAHLANFGGEIDFCEWNCGKKGTTVASKDVIKKPGRVLSGSTN
jgi:hypothetical protein